MGSLACSRARSLSHYETRLSESFFLNGPEIKYSLVHMATSRKAIKIDLATHQDLVRIQQRLQQDNEMVPSMPLVIGRLIDR